MNQWIELVRLEQYKQTGVCPGPTISMGFALRGAPTESYIATQISTKCKNSILNFTKKGVFNAEAL